MSNPKQRIILLVEDNPIIAMGRMAALSGFGYQMITAQSGEIAVDLVTQNKEIDLILMDVDLGQGIDGIEAVRQIIAIRNLPIVFLTSTCEREIVGKLRGVTSYGYVVKNSGDAVVQSAIETAFELFISQKSSKLSDIRALFEPRKFRVLLAEDEQALQETMSIVLKEMGLLVVVAKNGLVAVKIMEKEPCDLILMDVLMPELDGMEATKKIRKFESLARLVPIIGMTGLSAYGNEEICLNLGMNDFVSKPFPVQTLIQILKKWLLR